MRKCHRRNLFETKCTENATGMHGAPWPTSKIGVSSTRNHHFHEWHQTFKIASLAPKTGLLDAFRRQKCRFGVEIVSKLVGDTGGDIGGDTIVIKNVIWRDESRVTLRVTLGVTLQKIE